MMVQTVRQDMQTRPVEGWDDPARGSIRWRTLLSSDITPSHALVAGVAELEPGDHFAFHSHPDPEIYLGLQGRVTVVVDGQAQDLHEGVALFIPGGAVHGIPEVSQSCRFYYCFARDAFSGVAYSFGTEDKNG